MENQKNVQISAKNDKLIKKLKEYGYVSLGVLILNIAFYFFLSPSGIVTGGMLGVSILLQPIFEMIGSWFTASIFLYIVNFITLILGLIFLGKDFFLKTVYGTFLSPTILFVLERVFDPNYFLQTVSSGNYKIIALICGAIGAGIGIALAIKSNGSTGGMDVIQRIMSKYFKIPMSVAMYFTDWVVVLLAGFLMTNGSIREYTFIYQIENVIFGTIGVFAQGYIIDYICISGKSRRTVYIITNMEQEIKNLIYNSLNRGVTLVDVTGGYTNEGRTMLVCTMDKKEAYKITDMISELDPNAFTFVTSCKEVKGKYRSKKENYDM